MKRKKVTVLVALLATALTVLGEGFPDWTYISTYSPVELHVSDSFGNHVGLTPEGDVEIGIPGATYDDLDGSRASLSLRCEWSKRARS